jgi:LysM repeat protein
MLNSPTPAPAQTLPTSTPEPKATRQPKPELPMPTEGRPAAYTIKKGDHFLCIARRYNINPNELATLNGFGAWPETLVVGASLKLPSGGSFPGDRALRSHPASYTVQSSETVNSIACKFGDVLPEAILAKNGISEAELSSGMSLQIP